MRGHIVLFRRDRISFVNLEKAANMDNWEIQFRPDNPVSLKNASDATIRGIMHVQDVSAPYEGKEDEDIEAEKKYCQELLAYAREQTPPNKVDAPKNYKPFWVMNFTSGENGSSGGTAGYKDNASIMNPLAVSNIKNATTKGPTGIVYSDFVLIDETSDGIKTGGNDIVTTVLENNFAYAKDFILDDEIYNFDFLNEGSMFDNCDHYLRNRETGKYMFVGKSWVTRSLTDDHGIPFRFISVNSGESYYLKSTIGDGYYKSTENLELFVDGAESAGILFNIKPVEGTNFYRFVYENGAVALADSNGIVVRRNYDAADKAQQWEIIPENQLIAEVNATTKPVDASFLIHGYNINWNDTENNYWVTNSTKNVTVTIGATNRGGAETDAAMIYVVGGNGLTKSYRSFEISHKPINNIPNGKYTLSCNAWTNNSNARITVNQDSKMPDNSADKSEAFNTAASDFLNGNHVLSWDLTINDNNLDISISYNRTSINKFSGFYDSFRLTYLGKEQTVHVTFVDGYDTLILPFDCSIPDGLKVYTTSEFETDASNTHPYAKVIKLTEVGSIAANTPYVVKFEYPSIAALSDDSADSRTFTFTGLPNYDPEEEYSYGLLTGVYETHIGVDGDYIKTSNNDSTPYFAPVSGTNAMSVEPYHCYIRQEEVDPEKNVILFNASVSTEVQNVAVDALADAPADVYTITGMLMRSGVEAADALEGLTPGIYILRQGTSTKKVVLK